jgi:asparagine synthase (glutamine-hydrolysing)
MTGDPEFLKDALEQAVRDGASGINVGIAFSGGLDSGIVAAFAKMYAKNITLYTVGSEGSHDLREAEAAAKDLGIHLVHIPVAEGDILDSLREMMAITWTRDPVTLSFELPLFFVCKHCTEEIILTGQGADELFAGYSRYVGLEKDDLKKMMSLDLEKLLESTLIHEKKVAKHFGKKLCYPFLNERVIEAAESFGIDVIAPGTDPTSRKRVLREVADMIGCGCISAKEKKAAQYGSGIMAMIKKICKSKNITYAELIDELSGEVR